MKRLLMIVALVAATSLAVSGCSEGPLWKISRAAPWVQDKWAEEEKLAETVYSKRRKLQTIAEKSDSFTSEDSDNYATKLGQIIEAESTLVVRVEAVRTLARIKGEVADSIMAESINDAELDVRIASVQGMKYRTGDFAVPVLQQVIASDSSDDVRREAMRSIAVFDGPQVVAALGSMLDDRDPANQYRAIESLESVTGEEFGPNVSQWREYVAAVAPAPAMQENPTSIAGRPSDQR